LNCSITAHHKKSIGQDLVCLGVITGAHGIKGNVIIKSFTENQKDLFKYRPLTDATGTQNLDIQFIKFFKEQFLAKISGVTDRTSATGLKGLKLFAFQTSLPPTKSNEFYYSELVGLRVYLPCGEYLGNVTAIQNFGAGDLLNISNASNTEFLVPFTKDIVSEIDLTTGIINIDPPEGLF
jgi:16S rRNA processing protein RimM